MSSSPVPRAGSAPTAPPPVWMKGRDVVEVEISGIGLLAIPSKTRFGRQRSRCGNLRPPCCERCGPLPWTPPSQDRGNRRPLSLWRRIRDDRSNLAQRRHFDDRSGLVAQHRHRLGADGQGERFWRSNDSVFTQSAIGSAEHHGRAASDGPAPHLCCRRELHDPIVRRWAAARAEEVIGFVRIEDAGYAVSGVGKKRTADGRRARSSGRASPTSREFPVPTSTAWISSISRRK